MVLIGVFVAMWRRGRDRGAMSVQQFSNDLLPLILLFAISVTGLFLTVSTHLMQRLVLRFPVATARGNASSLRCSTCPLESSSTSSSVRPRWASISISAPVKRASRRSACVAASPLRRSYRLAI